MADDFVFNAKLLLQSNGTQFVREVRTIFRELEQEARRTISQGSQAGISGIPAQYSSALGQVAAIVARKPGLSERQQGLAVASLRGAEATYGRLQSTASAAGLNLPGLSGLQASYRTGSQLLDAALTRQSNAILRAAEDADKFAREERKAAREVELAAGRAKKTADTAGVPGSGLYGPPAPPPGSRYATERPIYGPPIPEDRPTYGPPAPPTRTSRFDTEAERVTAERTDALETRAALARRQAGDRGFLTAQAEATLAERQRAIATAKATREEAIERGQGGGTLFQRLQAAVHTRTNQTDTRLPQDFQSFGQFFTSKALTTGGFALSGAILYGAISGFREITREASALQRELAVVKSQFDELGDTRGFEQFSKRVVDISVETGIAADEVARVARQLAGVFRADNTGLPDFNRALNETQQALKLSQVTGLPFQEITDSLTAITVTFGTSFTQIGDLAIGLERRFGVLAPELIRFTADVAPVAKELGFTVEQITALGAIAQQRSGISGGALAENFNRALPAIQQTQIALAQMLAQRPETEPFIRPILTALSSAKGADALGQLTAAYAKMNQQQRQSLGALLGGERNAKAFFAVLQGGQDTIDALAGKTGDFTGSLDKRFHDFRETVEFAFERAKRALEQFGLSLFNSGLADGLKLVADNAALVAKFASVLLEIFSKFNSVLGGLPIKLAAVYTALRLITALGGAVGGARALLANVTGRATENATASQVPGQLSLFGAGAASRNLPGPNIVGPRLEAAIAGGGLKGILASTVTTLAPLVGAVAVAQLVSTIQSVGSQVHEAEQSFSDIVTKKIQSGVNPNLIIQQIKDTGSTGTERPKTHLSIPFTNIPLTPDFALPFGLGPRSPLDVGIDAIRKENAKRQGEELDVIAKYADDAQRRQFAEIASKDPRSPEAAGQTAYLDSIAGKGGLEELISKFKNNPTNPYLNDVVSRIIEKANGVLSPAALSELKALGGKYAKIATDAAAPQALVDYQPVLAEIKAKYDAGDASFDDLVAAEKHNIDLLKSTLDIVTGDARVQAATALEAGQRELDGYLTSRASRLGDLMVKIGTIKGGNADSLNLTAKTQALDLITKGGGSPNAQLDAALNVLDAQSKQLDTAINSPVFINGIARAPTAAEKLARASQGLKITPELRQAVIRAGLLVSKGGEIQQIVAASGLDENQIVDSVVKLLTEADHTEIDVLVKAILNKEATLRLELANLEPGDGDTRQRVQSGLAALQQARSALENLPATGAGVDPGNTITQDTTDLKNQAAIEASDEARALADAFNAQARARAHGDPVLQAQANLNAAREALSRAQASGKQSDVENAIAQIIDAENALDDANAQVISAFLGLAAASTHDPVKKAMFELEAAKQAVANAHGAAAQYEALARQVAAQESVAAAVSAVFQAQQNLLAAIATAAGDTVGAAQSQLAAARQQLESLIARDIGSGDDPNSDPEVIAARAAAVTAQANVRDTKLRQQESDIDIALQLEKITTAQAIAQFTALLKIPELTAEQTNEILLKIKQLQGELTRDLQFDIGSIQLPTIYEVRRAIGSGGLGAGPVGPGNIQDNRHTEINLYAATQVDLQPAVDVILDTVQAPPRNGARIGNY